MGLGIAAGRCFISQSDTYVHFELFSMAQIIKVHS
jgi:hypothetical protein